jgi:hypothetical protein
LLYVSLLKKASEIHWQKAFPVQQQQQQQQQQQLTISLSQNI